MSRIHLTIDRLALCGLDAGQRDAFVRSLTGELRKALAHPSARAAMTEPLGTPVLRLNRLALEPGQAGARKLGAQVARGICGGILKATGWGMKP